MRRTTNQDVGHTESITDETPNKAHLYGRAAEEYGAALGRLARAYEADPEKRRDLVQELHLALWRSFHGFDGRCSLRTWIYRVAHNTATSYGLRQKRNRESMVSIEELDSMPDTRDAESGVHQRHALERLAGLIRKLGPVDRQVIVSYLEGLDAAETAELTGLSAGNVATKIHRVKNILTRQFQGGGRHGE
jgi:RNA polymerase sigma-70 factor (ECF subfamily)